MENLDKKLEIVLIRLVNGSFDDLGGCVSAIKQAFADSGYYAVGDGSVVITDPGEIEIRHLHIFGTELMSGREWYDRFQRAYNDIHAGGEPIVASEDALEAAKRASGIYE